MPRSRKYHDLLIESLKDPKEAAGYLNAVIQETRDNSEESRQLLLLALKNVAEAQGGISQLSEKTGLGRESLYKTLSPKGNPRFTTVNTLMQAMGLELQFVSISKRK